MAKPNPDDEQLVDDAGVDLPPQAGHVDLPPQAGGVELEERPRLELEEQLEQATEQAPDEAGPAGVTGAGGADSETGIPRRWAPYDLAHKRFVGPPVDSIDEALGEVDDLERFEAREV